MITKILQPTTSYMMLSISFEKNDLVKPSLYYIAISDFVSELIKIQLGSECHIS